MTDQYPDTPPPETPPPGWYPDPVTGTGHRYWNGFAWTDDHSVGGTGGGGLQPVGPWLGEAFTLVFDRIGHLFTLIVILNLPASLLAGAVTYWALNDVVVNFDPDASDAVVSFDGLSAGRVAAVVIAALASTFASIVLAAAVSRHIVFARTDRSETWTRSLVGGAKRAPRVLGVTILIALVVIIGGLILLGIPLFMPVLYIVAIPAAIVLALIAWARFTLATTAAALAPSRTSSIKTSLDLSEKRTMAFLGRLILLTLIAIAAQVALSAISAPFSGGGTTVTEDQTAFPVIDFLGGSGWVFALQQAIGAIAGGFSAAIYGAAVVLLYLDLGGPLDDEFAYTPSSN